MSQLFAGFVLGLGLIVPIGSQNLYVLNQSLRLGLPRSLAVASAAAVCDIVLITVGSAGASVVLQRSQWLRLGLLVAGALFLAFLSVRSWRVPVGASGNAAGTAAPASQESVLRVVLTACSVSLLNPHAIIDTVGVIGAAVASAGEQALQFATGAGIASV
ncbi:MAG: LysE family transporter, partial [Bifidobacteriaceae bacterium]|nr:LysE family transporter [Bifidobacteriaceae bacterium]